MRLDGSVKGGLLFLLGLTASLAGFVLLSLSLIFKYAAVRKEYALVVLVELDYLEVELLVNLCLSSVFLNEVLGSGKAFNSVGSATTPPLSCISMMMVRGGCCLQ